MMSFLSSSAAAPHKTPLTKFLEGVSYMHTFPMPQPRPATSDFVAAFKTYSKTNPDTLNLMQDLMNNRIQMLTVMSSNGSLADQISAVEQYLQSVHNLHESLMTALDARQNVACDREVAFEWVLYLNSRPPFRSSSLVLEMIMLYHTKALLHYRTAQNMLSTDYVGMAADAGKQLLQAASIFDMIQGNISSSKWERKFHPKEPNPPECTASVCAAMSLYCRSRAQATALTKAMAENKMSAMVKSRLALGIAHLSSQACDAFVSSVPAYVKKENWVVLPLVATVGSDREIARAIGQHFLALHCADPTATAAVGGIQLGQALSCLACAKVLLQEQRHPLYEPSIPGLPKVTQFPYTGLTYVKDITAYLQTQWNELSPVWDRENRMIYFQVLPKTVEEYPIPTPSEAIVANAPSFKEVESLIIPFIDPPKAVSVFSSFFRGFGNNSSSSSSSASAAAGDNNNNNNNNNSNNSNGEGVVPEGSLLSASMLMGNGVPDLTGDGNASLHSSSAVPQRDLTDEEFARELQRRLNVDTTSSNNSNNSSISHSNNAAAPSAPPSHLLQSNHNNHNNNNNATNRR